MNKIEPLNDIGIWGNEPARAAREYQARKAAELSENANIGLDHFYAYMPMHNYIFTPTGEVWPASSVNSRLRSVENGTGKIALRVASRDRAKRP